MRLLPLAVIVAVILIVIIWNWEKLFPGPEPAGGHSVTPGSIEAVGEAGEAGGGDTLADIDAAQRRWIEATGTAPVWPDDFAAPRDCAAAVADLRTLCARLDSREYIADWNLEGGSFGLIVGASRDLDSAPPGMESGAGRHSSMIQNISHLFRVLGEKRIRRVLQITILEPEMREPMAMALFRWARVRERCGGDDPRGMSLDAQYEYASWMISTVGGQAYLRRRAPALEALASFYALLILDSAEEKGHNPHGIDLRSEMRRCRELMRNQDLLFRDRYLEMIENMEQRWRDR
jgi:hypothetical protein